MKFSGWMPRMDSAVSDLPLPVSPTIAVITPGSSAKPTSNSTGVISPPGDRKAPLSPSTSSSGALIAAASGR